MIFSSRKRLQACSSERSSQSLFFPFCFVLYDQADLALTVSLALFVSSSAAGIIALVLPWLLSRTGADPAFGSGPLATVIQDLLSIVIYLALATVIM